MDPTQVIFAIEAGVRLGRKMYEVLLDETVERSLFLPVGDLFGSIAYADAREFFDEHPDLIADGGPFHGLAEEEKLKAYKTVLGINQQIGNIQTVTREAVEVVENLHAFEQYKQGFGAKPAVQRLLGTIVEIGIDYAIANPNILGRDSSTRQYINAFIVGLDETDFAEGEVDAIACDVFVSGLKVFHENVTLVTSDKRLEVLLGGMTGALIEDFKSAPTLADQSRRRAFFKRVSANMIKGTLGAFAQNAELFIKGDKTSKIIIRSTVTQVIDGLKDKEGLLTNDALELLVMSAFRAVSENADLITDNKIIQRTIQESLETLTESEEEIFSESTVAVILQNALSALGENMDILIDPSEPERVFLAESISAVSEGLSSTLSGGKVKDLFSTAQIIQLTKIVFREVSENPELLLGDSVMEPRKTALAQIISSVSKALGDDPRRIISGEGTLEIMRDALEVSILNADKLLDLDTEDPATNLLYNILHELATAVLKAADPRRLLTRKAFKEMAKRVMSTTSSNLDLILEGQHELVGKTVKAAMTLANDALENRINGKNLPLLIERLLRQVLEGELNLEDENAFIEATKKILKNI